MHDEPQQRHEAREDNDPMNTPPASVERELAGSEWREHLAQRPRTDLGVDAATLLAEERALRDAELG